MSELYNARAQPLFYSSNRLFGDDFVSLSLWQKRTSKNTRTYHIKKNILLVVVMTK